MAAETMLLRAQRYGTAKIEFHEHLRLYGAYLWESDGFRAARVLKGVASAELVNGRCELSWAAGERASEWVLPVTQRIEEDAKDEGKCEIALLGRRGWWRYLAPLAWEHVGVKNGKIMLRKVL